MERRLAGWKKLYLSEEKLTLMQVRFQLSRLPAYFLSPLIYPPMLLMVKEVTAGFF